MPILRLVTASRFLTTRWVLVFAPMTQGVSFCGDLPGEEGDKRGGKPGSGQREARQELPYSTWHGCIHDDSLVTLRRPSICRLPLGTRSIALQCPVSGNPSSTTSGSTLARGLLDHVDQVHRLPPAGRRMR